MARISKKTLIDSVSKSISSTLPQIKKTEITTICDSFLESLKQSLKDGDGVQLADFGIFTPAVAKGGERRNPKTGDKITVADSNKVKFKMSASFKETLNS